MSPEIISVLVASAIQIGISILGFFFVISRSQAKISAHVDSMELSFKKDIESINKTLRSDIESINKTLDLKLQMMANLQESLNIRVSKLEQFRDDYYSSKIFTAIAPKEP